MSTDADNAVAQAEATPEKPKKKRTRTTHRLGTQMKLKEYPVPDGGLTAVPSDWDIQTHKELRADEFADVLHYFQWLPTYGQALIEASQAKVKELEAFGDADTRKEMSELFGGTAQLAAQVASSMGKENLTPEQKAKAAAQIKDILAAVLS